jgi:hypothetical protein
MEKDLWRHRRRDLREPIQYWDPARNGDFLSENQKQKEWQMVFAGDAVRDNVDLLQQQSPYSQ